MALKLLKNRRSEVAVENDLRGLGKTSLFGDLTPEPLLTTETVVSTLPAFAHDLSIQLHPHHAGGTHFHCVHPNLSHKEKALNLFAFSLLMYLHSGVRATVWEHNRLHAELHLGIHETPQLLEAPVQGEAALVIASAIHLHLKQAGLELIGVQQAEMFHIEAHQIESCLRQFSNTSKQNSFITPFNLKVA